MKTRQGRRAGAFWFLSAALLVCGATHAAEPGPLEARKAGAKFRLTYDSTMLPGKETMGLLGLNYLFDFDSSFYAGVAGYAAVVGKRGGFFTGGLEAGWEPRIGRSMRFDLGAFVGGGGGGAAPQGGGLMLRPHIGFLYESGVHRYGLAYSWVDYPNGSISSQQVAFQYESSVSEIVAHAPSWVRHVKYHQLPREVGVGARFSRSDLSAVVVTYFPLSGSRDTGGAPLTSQTNLVGLRWRRFLKHGRFATLEGAGSAGGATDGYAQIVAGLGYFFPFRDHKHWTALLNSGLGAAGGGTVDTGGGLITSTEAGILYRGDSGMTAELGVGYVSAPEGHYRAWSGSLRVGYAARTLGYSSDGRPVLGNVDLDVFHWRVRPVHVTYTNPAWKGAPRGSTVNLLGMKFDYLLNRNFTIGGQALAAYEGGAGGYAAGLLDLGWTSDPFLGKRLRLTADWGIGAAGGGSIDTGGGMISQGTFGLSYAVNRRLDLDLGYGAVTAVEGGLNTPVIEFGLSYRFATLGQKV